MDVKPHSDNDLPTTYYLSNMAPQPTSRDGGECHRRLGGVAVVGSSGGGTATLGHTDPVALLRCLEHQLTSVGGHVRHALYVSLDGGKGMDAARLDHDIAALYRVNCTNDNDDNHDPSPSRDPDWCRVVHRGTLRQVNQVCHEIQRTVLATDIRNGRVRGLVLISCHVPLFADALAAASSHIPSIAVTGSGGSSLARAVAEHRLNLSGNAGGSVATTSHTKAVSYTHALAIHYDLSYQPWLPKHDEPSSKRPRWTSVLNACLPAFWGVCLLKFVLRAAMSLAPDGGAHGLLAPFEDAVQALETWALPVACAVIMATTMAEATAQSSSVDGNMSLPAQNVSSSSSGLVMASIVATAPCASSAASGLVAGKFVASASDRVLYGCIFRNVPATMTNLLTGGGVGVAVALLMLPVAPFLRTCTRLARSIILASVCAEPRWHRMSAGAMWGVLSCYGSKVGGYHAVHLPLILMEMESGSASFLGAIDELTLVLVCSGICAGNLASAYGGSYTRQSDADLALCRRGLRTNIWFGDFVECCYPYMESSRLVNFGGYMGSALSSAWLVADATDPSRVPKSLAYLPLPVSIALAGSNWRAYALSCLLAFMIPFVATLLHRLHQNQSQREAQTSEKRA